MVKVEWTAPMRFEGRAEGAGPLVMDAKVASGGAGAGPNPVETLLMALAACSGMDVVSILGKMRAPLEALSIEAGGERRREHPRVFTRIHLRFIARGAGLQEEQVRRAVALSQETYCTVSAMLRPAAPITFDVVVEPEGRAL